MQGNQQSGPQVREAGKSTIRATGEGSREINNQGHVSCSKLRSTEASDVAGQQACLSLQRLLIEESGATKARKSVDWSCASTPSLGHHAQPPINPHENQRLAHWQSPALTLPRAAACIAPTTVPQTSPSGTRLGSDDGPSPTAAAAPPWHAGVGAAANAQQGPLAASLRPGDGRSGGRAPRQAPVITAPAAAAQHRRVLQPPEPLQLPRLPGKATGCSLLRALHPCAPP